MARWFEIDYHVGGSTANTVHGIAGLQPTNWRTQIGPNLQHLRLQESTSGIAQLFQAVSMELQCQINALLQTSFKTAEVVLISVLSSGLVS